MGAVVAIFGAGLVVFIVLKAAGVIGKKEEAEAIYEPPAHIKIYQDILAGAAQLGDSRFADKEEIEKNFSGGGVLLGRGKEEIEKTFSGGAFGYF